MSPKWTPCLSIFLSWRSRSFSPFVGPEGKGQVYLKPELHVSILALSSLSITSQSCHLTFWGSFVLDEALFKHVTVLEYNAKKKKFSFFQCMCYSHAHAHIYKLTQLPYSFFKYCPKYCFRDSHFTSSSPYDYKTSSHLVSLSNLYRYWNYLKVFRSEKWRENMSWDMQFST